MKNILGIFLVILSAHIGVYAQETDIAISGEWARPVLVAGRPGGAYMMISNNGAEADRLISATASIASRVEIHEHTMTQGVMRMGEVKGGLAIPAGGTVELKPGGYHIMMFETDNTYGIGDKIELKLTFEKAGTIEKILEIKARQPE